MAAEELTTSQQKLQKRIGDLQEEISREKSLRTSLEESHNTLLTRVREMESIVEVERNQVGNFSKENDWCYSNLLYSVLIGPRQANLVLIAYASSEG